MRAQVSGREVIAAALNPHQAHSALSPSSDVASLTTSSAPDGCALPTCLSSFTALTARVGVTSLSASLTGRQVAPRSGATSSHRAVPRPNVAPGSGNGSDCLLKDLAISSVKNTGQAWKGVKIRGQGQVPKQPTLSDTSVALNLSSFLSPYPQ